MLTMLKLETDVKQSEWVTWKVTSSVGIASNNAKYHNIWTHSFSLGFLSKKKSREFSRKQNIMSAFKIITQYASDPLASYATNEQNKWMKMNLLHINSMLYLKTAYIFQTSYSLNVECSWTKWSKASLRLNSKYWPHRNHLHFVYYMLAIRLNAMHFKCARPIYYILKYFLTQNTR